MEDLLNPGSGDNSDGDEGLDLLGAKKKPDAVDPKPVEREWMKDLPEPLRTAKSLQKFTDQEWKANLAKSYLEAESKLGGSVKIPAKDASPEEWAKYYDKVGRPKDADGYAIERGSVDDSVADRFKVGAHKYGLTVDQAKGLFGELSEALSESRSRANKAYTARMKEADATLRREYGPQYDSAIADARTVFELVFDEKSRAEIAESGLATNPNFIRSLAKLGPQVRGDSFLKGVGTGQGEADPLDFIDKKYKPR